ncbi:PP2A regulatory subunit TAP46 [Tanacetum coccineum]|uniref:PP2A regulatory subunit TAP46 n=1 Tax=Tanacetum coccineum TaxID=301880 RepID=A0ABQ5F9A5_9ASTR
MVFSGSLGYVMEQEDHIKFRLIDTAGIQKRTVVASSEQAKIWDIPAQEKLEHLFHLLSLVLPLVKQIHFEQCSELELERKLFLIKLAKFTFNHLIPPSIRVSTPVPFYLVELIEKTGGHDDKIDILKLSQAKLKVLPVRHRIVLKSFACIPLPEDELEASTQGGQNAVVDKRVKKIAWFKRQRAAESKLLELNKRKERRGRSTRAIALSSPVDTGDDNVQDDDGEEERQEGNVEISQAILKECAKTVEDGHRNAAARARYTKPTVPITCASFAQDVLEGRA